MNTKQNIELSKEDMIQRLTVLKNYFTKVNISLFKNTNNEEFYNEIINCDPNTYFNTKTYEDLLNSINTVIDNIKNSDRYKEGKESRFIQSGQSYFNLCKTLYEFKNNGPFILGALANMKIDNILEKKRVDDEIDVFLKDINQDGMEIVYKKKPDLVKNLLRQFLRVAAESDEQPQKALVEKIFKKFPREILEKADDILKEDGHEAILGVKTQRTMYPNKSNIFTVVEKAQEETGLTLNAKFKTLVQSIGQLISTRISALGDFFAKLTDNKEDNKKNKL